MTRLNVILVVVYWVIILLNFAHNTYAADKSEYPLFDIITTTDLNSIEGADVILSSSPFKTELKAFALSLKEQEIANQSMFNKIALLSLREDLEAINKLLKQQNNTLEFSHYQLYHQTKQRLKNKNLTPAHFTDEAKALIQYTLAQANDEDFVQMALALGWSVPNAKDYALNVYKQVQNKAMLTPDEMINIAVNSHLYHVLEAIIPLVNNALAQQRTKRFIIEPNVLVQLKNGIELSTTIVRRRHQNHPLTTALQYTIYADEAGHIKSAMHAAAHGYIGIVANSRGKRSSSNDIVPWQHEGEDAAQLIHWITAQEWSNGSVVMYGGSYNGFTQWATAKYMPTGLKAMAPFVAANLITGLPYENNIAITANFEWPLYVTNNKTVDNSVYNNWQRSEDIVEELFVSGRPIVDIDKIAKKPNPWLQKWLENPKDNAYYQNMVPHQHEYKRINIPVLTITGYFEGGQISALNYLNQHYQYNKNANHSLLIGPYNHWSAQSKPRSHHSNYELDPVALLKDTEEVVFDWFDHVLYDKPKPTLVQNKVNYQVMGANTWRFADSLQELNQQTKSFYIQSAQANKSQNYALGQTPSAKTDEYIEQIIDMSDRTEQRNMAPWPVIQDNLDKQGGIQIETPVFEQDMELTGSITGFFDIGINKKDVDIGFNYFEVTANGEVFHLNNYRSRASYADDMGKRHLLIPNEKRRVPIVNARFTSKLIKKGSKLVLVLNVNKNVAAQVNLGTGKPVNYEHISEAGEPLKLKWFLSSQINLPLKPWPNAASHPLKAS
ncbi:CocE/NonD family hydrolase [Thalassotalea aquiviva]|uniref:CocE/NonD family hydrolase n=1 Tax=Thalassotalea aquiviva TaxID=3242415 RepID=UPI00352A2F7C